MKKLMITTLFLVGGGLGLAIFTGYVMRDPSGAAHEGAGGSGWTILWLPLLRYVVPAVLLVVLLASVPGTLAKLAGLF